MTATLQAAAPSFWLEQLGERPVRPALAGSQEADVCIVGAGFTGLWTAYELCRADPELRVVVLEARYAGFGASGRNGGWVYGTLSGSPAAWRRRAGPRAAGEMARAIQATLGEIAVVVRREQIACDWHQGGALAAAQTEPRLERLRSQAAAEREALGDAAASTLLDAAELEARVAVAGGLGALYNPHCARVQPAKLLEGLAGAAERCGATIHESSPVTEIAPGRLSTPGGELRAPKIVIATEGYTANLPGRHRRLLPLNSSMVVTEPLAAEVWAELRWQNAETLHEAANLYTYSQRTADGRIAIGGRGVPYLFGSRTEREGPVPERTVRELRERLAGLFPALREVGITRAWHGVLGVARDWCPMVSFDARTGIGFAGGYAGEGVAAANLAARTLRDLLLGHDTELVRLPWVGPGARSWEPEPLRFLGARGVYALYGLADQREAATGHRSRFAALANWVARR